MGGVPRDGSCRVRLHFACDVVDKRLLYEQNGLGVHLAGQAAAGAEVDQQVGVPVVKGVLGGPGGGYFAPAGVKKDDRRLYAG